MKYLINLGMYIAVVMLVIKNIKKLNLEKSYTDNHMFTGSGIVDKGEDVKNIMGSKKIKNIALIILLVFVSLMITNSFAKGSSIQTKDKVSNKVVEGLDTRSWDYSNKAIEYLENLEKDGRRVSKDTKKDVEFIKVLEGRLVKEFLDAGVELRQEDFSFERLETLKEELRSTDQLSSALEYNINEYQLRKDQSVGIIAENQQNVLKDSGINIMIQKILNPVLMLSLNIVLIGMTIVSTKKLNKSYIEQIKRTENEYQKRNDDFMKKHNIPKSKLAK